MGHCNLQLPIYYALLIAKVTRESAQQKFCLQRFDVLTNPTHKSTIDHDVADLIICIYVAGELITQVTQLIL